MFALIVRLIGLIVHKRLKKCIDKRQFRPNKRKVFRSLGFR